MEGTKEMAQAISFCYNLFDRGRRSLHQGGDAAVFAEEENALWKYDMQEWL